MKIVQMKFKSPMIATDLRLLVESMNDLGLLYQLRVPQSMHDDVWITVRGPEDALAKLARVTGLQDAPLDRAQLEASHAVEDFLAEHGDPQWPGSVKEDRP
jgi:hypothetical protein